MNKIWLIGLMILVVGLLPGCFPEDRIDQLVSDQVADQFGEFQSILEELKKEIDSKLDDLESKIDDVESKVDDVKSKVDNVKSKLDDLESKVDDVESLLN
ncbi:MAG TPA: hypothetical protein VFF04_00790 [Candidatus Babeliales bacterium]|nr:hypothetical protein [Candidatus Babeliales bacterium]